MPLQPTTLNLRLSTPNKLFECLAAGIPVVASDFPGIRAIVMDDPEGPLGAVCDPASVDAVAAAISSILRLDRAEMDALRARCSRAAAARWNWDHEAEALLSVYAKVLAEPA
jgi:glycosyltransferase involved in cell wall biosynthesis